MINRRGQVTIFIIIALVIVAGVAVYIGARGGLSATGVPAEFSEVYTTYEQCIAQETSAALEVAGSHGGYVEDIPHVPGSEYAPFSSHLNFLGLSVPYWYYVSGNGIIKENIPSMRMIEQSIEASVANGLSRCNFDSFYERGISLTFEEPEVSVRISDSKVSVDVTASVSASKEERAARKRSHHAEVASRFGTFYKEAVAIYDKEKREAFLENYSVDVLRLYAPVDGVEIGCGPRVWKSREVVDELHRALEANIGAIQLKEGGQKTYFTVQHASPVAARFLYSREWPSRVNIEGTDGELMIAEPLGNQEGLGVLGFCYAPYHFVYDMSFPVMVQLYDESEVFQFPVVVVIDKNMPREGILSEVDEEENIELCRYKTNNITVAVYDANLTPLDASISYGCFSERCLLGSTINGTLISRAPACLNGYLYVQADGFTSKKQLFSSATERRAEVIIDKEYPVTVSIQSGGKPLRNTALVTFTSGERVRSLLLPDITAINLSEGFYNITVYAYENSSINIPATTKNECRDMPQRGLSGFFGATRRECFDVQIPATTIDHALIGGGVGEQYFLESQLASGNLILTVGELPKPTSLAELQTNYEAFDGLRVDAEFKP